MPRGWDLNRRIVIRGLPGNASKGEIALAFDKYGRINNIFIAKNPPGFAFIEYFRRRDAELAVERGNGKRVCGVRVSTELTIRDLDRTVVVRNLKRAATKEDIRKLFHDFGFVKRVWLDGTQHVLAFVEYVRKSHAKKAVRALDGKHCCGTRISVSLPRQPNTQNEYSTDSSSSDSSCCERIERARKPTQPIDSPASSNTRSKANVTSIAERSSSQQRLGCSICTHDTLENRPTSTVCGHVFCENCIKSAISHHGKCPNCQRKLEENHLTRLYPSF